MAVSMSRSHLRLDRLSVSFALWVAGCGVDAPVSSSRAASTAAPTRAHTTPRTEVGASAIVVSRSERGRPRLIRGLRGGPVAPGDAAARARQHLRRLAFSWDARSSDVDALVHVSSSPVGRAGAVLVSFRQSSASIPWNDGEVRVLLAGDGTLLAVRGWLRPDEAPPMEPMIDADEALEAALDGCDVVTATVRRVLVDASGKPLVAYRIEARLKRADNEAVRLLVDARDGSILSEESLVHRDAYAYRVFADPATFLPEDAPTVDVSPYPGGAPDGMLPAFVAPSLVTLDGLPRPSSTVDPFIPGNVSTLAGNHVVAFVDRALPTGFGSGDLDVPTTSSLAFDYVYDTSLDALANATQARAGATHAFYVASYLHDWYYGSGFDEVSGNAQASNYGRGGLENDALQLEAQDAADSGRRDNASMLVFADGTSPVMQVAVWTRNRPPDLSASGIGAIPAGYAEFGPAEYSVVAELALAVDGSGVTSDACEPLTNSASGRIVLAERGSCTFETKTLRAQEAGALGLLLADFAGSPVPPRLGDDVSLDGTIIPTASITFTDGAALISALTAGAVTVSLSRPAGLLRDAALDTTIVAHEWGHYLHLRSMTCLNRQCAAVSEGMADFVALHLMLEDGDDLDGAFAVGSYAGRLRTSTPGYFGVRRAPYSTSASRNAFSFRHIGRGEALPTTHPIAATLPDNAQIHNAGEIWASMLWDGYVALVREGGHSFETARRWMSDILVAAVKLSPDDATFLESRDAVLAAAEAVDSNAARLFAQAFAGRGAGSCAIGPARTSQDFSGIAEDTRLGGRISLGEPQLVLDSPSCDGDSFLDAGESGSVRVRLANLGVGPLTNVSIEFGSDLPNLVFPDGSTSTVASVPPLGFIDLSIPVSLTAGSGNATGTITVSASAQAECDATDTEALSLRVDADSVDATSATDDVESDASAWTVFADPNRETWSRFGREPGNVRYWSAIGPAYAVDRSLVSPVFTRDTSEPLSIAFDYRHDLEADGLSGELLDAVVLEVSTDSGGTWTDVSMLGAVPYATSGVIASSSGNPLVGRPAFGGRSASYPAWQRVMITLDSLPGSSVRFRFRFVSDVGTSSGPFDLDDIAISGVVETPFATVVADPGGCVPGAPDGGLTDADAGVSGSLRGGGGCAVVGGGRGRKAGSFLDSPGVAFASTLMLVVRARARRRRALPSAG